MENKGLAVRHYKNSIINMKAVLTYYNNNKDYIGKTGTIFAGYKSYRFFFKLDDDKTIIPLFEEDEICLIPE
jgi:hypothetical protein